MYSALKKYACICLLFFCALNAKAAHLVGAELTYDCLGSDQYEVTLHIYKNAFSGINLDAVAFIYAIDKDDNTVFDTIMAPRISIDTLPDNNIGCVIGGPNVQTQDGYYEALFTLPLNINGYDIIYARCCRTNGTTNMITAGTNVSGMSVKLSITRDAMLVCNDGPEFRNPPPILICNNSPLYYDQSVTDNDGDYFEYGWCYPLGNPLTAACDFYDNPAAICNILSPIQLNPFPELSFVSGSYNLTYPMGVSAPDPVVIHPTTGIMTGTAHINGLFQLAYCVNEYRNGVLMSTTIRDFQLSVTSCQIVTAATDRNYNSCDNTVEFNNYSTASDVYFWDFGDGNTSTATNPVHTYASTGMYTVTLIAGQSGVCYDTTTAMVNIIYESPPDAEFAVDSICEGTTFTFNNLTVDSLGLVDGYEWTIDGNVYTDFEPSVPFPDGGLFDVQLVAINDSGCYDTAFLQIPVFDTIIPDVSLQTFYCDSDSVLFINNSTGAIDSLIWDFGDGNTSTVFNPTHQYMNPGTYTVDLTMFNSRCGNKTFQETFSIVNQPVVDLGPDLDVCNGPPLTFSIDTTGIGNAAINWSTGSGDPSVTFPATTTTLFVEVDNFGCVDRDTIDITGTDSIVLDVDLDDVYCGLSAVNFTNNSTGSIDSLLWEFGDGDTSTAFNPSHTYAGPGYYTVNLTLFNSVCGDQVFTKTIYVATTPVFDLGPPRDICIGSPNVFTIDTTGFGPVSILWSTGDTTPSVTVTGGLPSLSVTVDNGCLATDLVLLNDIDSITAAFGIPASSCVTNAVSFSNTSSGAIDSVLWDFGDGSTSTQFSPTYTYSGDGIYTVTATLYNSSCGDITETGDIYIAPEPVFDLGTPRDICIGSPNVFTIDTTGFGPVSILWSTGDTTPSVTVTGGLPSLSVTVDNGCLATDLVILNDIDSITAAIGIPAASCITDAVSFSNTSSGAIDSVLWDFGDGSTSTQFSPSYTYSSGGNYTVTATLYNSSCGDITETGDIYISPEPVFDLGPPQDICLGAANIFSIDTTGFGPVSILWSTGDTTPSVTLTGGLPSLSVTVDNGCTASDMVILNDVDSLSPDVVIPSNACVTDAIPFTNNTTGSVDSILWDFGDGNTSTVPSPMHTYGSGGSYTVTVTLFNSVCGDASTTGPVAVSDQPALELGPPQDICMGSPSVFTVDTTGFGPASIIWSTGDTTPSVSVSGGLASLSVVVDNGCLATDTLMLNDVDPISPDVIIPSSACVTDAITFTNNSTGAIDSILWDFGDGNISTASSPMHTYSSGGNYTVTATLFNAVCGDAVVSGPISVADFPVFDLGPPQEICLSVPQVFTIDTTGFGPASITWSTGDTTPSVSVSGGLADLSVTVDNGCLATDLVVLTDRDSITLDISFPDNVCSSGGVNFINNSTGHIDSVLWVFGDGNTSTDFSPNHIYASAGLYSVSVTLFNSACGDKSYQKDVGIGDPPVIDLGPPQELCTGIPHLFQIDTTGIGAASILWSTGDTTPQTWVTGGATDVSVTVDYYGCVAVELVALTSSDSIQVDIQADPVHCISDAVVFTNNSSGHIDSISWDFGDGNSSSDMSPSHTYTSSGAYAVTATLYNASCGNETYNTSITIVDVPAVDLGADITACDNSPYLLNIDTTGFGPSTITWTTGDNTPSVNIAPGTPEVGVSVDNGCIVSDTVLLTWSSPIVVAAVIQASGCITDDFAFQDNSTGTVDSLLWNFGDGNTSTDPAPTHTYASAGTYTVTLDLYNSACGDGQTTGQVTVSDIPNAYIGGDIDICSGIPFQASIDTTGNGPSAIIWSTGDMSPTITVPGGLTELAVEVDNGCIATDTVSVAYTDSIILDVDVDPVHCLTDAVLFTNNSSGTIDAVFWQFGDGASSTDFSPVHNYTTEGVYTVQLDLANAACGDKQFSTQIAVNVPIEVDLGSDIEACSGVPFTVVLDTSGFGPHSLEWSTGATVPQVTITGGATNLSVEVDNGCISGDDLDITYLDAIDPAVTIPANGCSGDSAFFENLSGGDISSVTWDFGDGTGSSQLSPYHTFPFPGNYLVSVTMTNPACGDTTIQGMINIRNTPAVDLGGPQELCTGVPQLFSIDTTGFGGASIIWSTGDTTPSTYVTGGATDVSVSVDYFGCTASDIAALTSSDSVTVNIDFDDLYCISNSIAFNNSSSGDISGIAWDFGDGNTSTEFSPVHTYSAPGTYNVTVTMDNAACGPGSFQQPVTIAAQLTAEISGPASVCTGDPATYSIDTTGYSGASIIWSTGSTGPSTTINNGAPSVSVTVENGCTATDALNISYVNGIQPDVSIPDQVCLDNTAFFNNQSTGDIESVTWDFGDGNSSAEFSPTHQYGQPGTYQVVLDMINSGCGDVTIQEAIQVISAPYVDLGPTLDICEGFEEIISIDTSGFYGADIEWSTGETGPAIVVSQGNTIVSVTVDLYGCIVRDELIISNECPIFIPTAFTPDGFNTTFNVINKNIEEYELRIYNRWGEQLYSTNDFFRGWDGTYKGTECEMDVYVWILTGTKIGGQPFTESGTVMLVR